MVFINNIDDQKFSLNGIQYFKNFQPLAVANYLKIVGVYDSKVVLAEATKHNEFEVNGVTYGSVAALQAAILPVLYSRGTLNGSSGPVGSGDVKPLLIGVTYSAEPTLATFAQRINAKPSFTVVNGQLPVFYLYNPVLYVPGEPLVPQKPSFRLFLKNKGAGTYGVGSTTPLTKDDLIIISQTEISVDEIENLQGTQIIYLGEIGTANVWDFLNLKDPIVSIQDATDGYRLVKTLVDGVYVRYLFLGIGGDYGVGGLQSVEGDFDIQSGEIPSSGGGLEPSVIFPDTKLNYVDSKSFTIEEGVKVLTFKKNGSTISIDWIQVGNVITYNGLEDLDTEDYFIYNGIKAVSIVEVGDISGKEDKSNKGIANGYAPLGADSKVPYSFLPTPIDISGKEDVSNKISAITGSSTAKYTSEKAIVDYVDAKISQKPLHVFYKLPVPLTGTTALTVIHTFPLPAIYQEGRRVRISGRLLGTGTGGKTLNISTNLDSLRNIAHSISRDTNSLPFVRNMIFFDNQYIYPNSGGAFFNDESNSNSTQSFSATPFQSESTVTVWGNLVNTADSIIAIDILFEFFD